MFEQHGVSPARVELEITETTLMMDAARTLPLLDELRAMGVHLSIDDFGTGYSSLSYLKRFPIHKLKIDRSFIRDVSFDMDDAAIVRAIIALSHNMRLKVVDEGVETADQLQFLRTLGCDEYQGFYKSQPLTAHDFERTLRAERREGFRDRLLDEAQALAHASAGCDPPYAKRWSPSIDTANSR